VRKELEERLSGIFKTYEMLDNAEFLLSADTARIKRMAAQYKQSLEEFLFLLIDERLIERVSYEAAKKYADTMAKYMRNGTLKKVRIDRQKLVDNLLEMWQSQAASIAARSAANLNAKGAQFKALSIAMQVPEERLREIEKQNIAAVRIDGKLYKHQELGKLWERMNKAYGTLDTIQYNNGTNYPLRSYVDMRETTTEAETHRATTLIEGAADGMWFCTTNKTGTTDSCLVYEAKIMFLSDEARSQAIEHYGDLPQFANMQTWQQVVSGPTHMGKPGCQHILRVVPLQFYAKGKALETIRASASGAQPEKVNERNYFEKATGQKFVSQSSEPKKRYKEIPPVAQSKGRSTIA